MLELGELLDSTNESEIERGLLIEHDLKTLVEKYSSEGIPQYDLKEPMFLRKIEDMDSEVISFYIYENWIYLLTDASDIDPYDLKEDFLKKFINYISDERNVTLSK